MRSQAPRSSGTANRSEEHTSELQSRPHLVCRLLLEKILCSSLFVDLDIHEVRCILPIVGKRLKNVFKCTTMSLCDHIVQFVSCFFFIHAPPQLPAPFPHQCPFSN